MIRTIIHDSNGDITTSIDWPTDNDAKAFMFDCMQGVEIPDLNAVWYYDCCLEDVFTQHGKQHDVYGLYICAID